ncbi:MAG: ATPase [Rhodospirillales bacterium RIFCSPLOWO2_12_FULL_58_28]|nr:MAG: ATPase [Rhodospirillales bacterium RIFCSPLOWO2_02_FULL_58_16]OHC77303.1 MAG: ATPase [Rhodospirillales bacterium RIFCSPLOWO2_12_FULL_58_28]
MDDLLTEFLTETTESLAVIDAELVKFEQNPNDKAILSNIFRLVHTIKGTCGFLGLPRLEKVAHAGEDVLGLYRDGKLKVTPESVTVILKCIDRIKALLEKLEASGEEQEGEDSELISELRGLIGGASTPKPVPLGAAPVFSAPGIAVNATGAPVAAELLAEVEAAMAAGAKAASDEQIAAENAAKLAAEKGELPAPVDEKSVATAEAKVPAAPKKTAPPAEKKDGESKESAIAAQSIRVNVDLLENLMTLVSELVLTRNQLLQMVRGHDDSEFHVPLQRLSHITSDLQEGVMKTRMQPIGNAWAKLPRIVRDLSVETHKKIDLQMIGQETELDRQVLELIKDPLTHMVRNSADHGLETPPDRTAAGKLEMGKIVLEAFHEGGHIIIRIADDGRGLNMGRIKAKVIENGLAGESELEAMTDEQIQQFILRPGFSTAAKITSVSGRGVGMDVVKTNIEKIGGTIEFKSVEGKGSTFTIKIPLTLAIVSALVVACGNERFAIPQISVLELVRTSAHSDNTIEMINDSPVLRLRNRLLPLVSLQNLLKLGDRKDATREELFIVVTQVGSYTFGVIVDRVFDTEEIVVKPVSPILREIPFYSGNTILGDGSVIMILDPNGIAAASGQGAGGDAASSEPVAIEHGDEKTSMLIFSAGGKELRAVPLALVARLEEIDMASTEVSHNQIVVQYRDHLMPLIPFNTAHQWKKDGRQPILVFTDRKHSMGLVVDTIVDIVEERLNIELASNMPGIIGSAIINGKATDVIDAGFFLTQAFSDWFGAEESKNPAGKDNHSKRVLLVDDSPFFRNLLAPLLSVAGYKVTTSESAQLALKLLEGGAAYDVIISDIEMPGMNGFEFAETVRADARWKNVPMIALSSHATEQDFERGRKVGFNDYVAKFDREALVGTLAGTVLAATS